MSSKKMLFGLVNKLKVLGFKDIYYPKTDKEFLPERFLIISKDISTKPSLDVRVEYSSFSFKLNIKGFGYKNIKFNLNGKSNFTYEEINDRFIEELFNLENYGGKIDSNNIPKGITKDNLLIPFGDDRIERFYQKL